MLIPDLWAHTLTPIVFIHQGTASYVPLALLQARHSNPDSPVYLIGDRGNVHLSGLARHVPMGPYMAEARQLASLFVNRSTNGAAFELVCLQRWLVLEAWMRATGIDQCLYLDTDVLLYDQAQEHMMRLGRPGMTLSGISGHTNFIGDRGVLAQFGAFMMELYGTPEGRAWIEDAYTEHRKKHRAGGISDMTLLTEFARRHPDKVRQISEPVDGAVFDITLDYTAHYRARDGVKEITFDSRDGMPYGFHLPTGRLVKFVTLHFQGTSKPLLPGHCQVKGGRRLYWQGLNALAGVAGKLGRKLHPARRPSS